MRFVLRPCALFVAASLFGHAVAQSEDLQEEQPELNADQLRALHKKLDLNGDGKVSVEEILQYAKEHEKTTRMDGTHFKNYDADGDEKITVEEHLAGLQKEMMASLPDFGAQGGGDDQKEQIMESFGQMAGMEHEKFEAADLDGDGHLSIHEWHGLMNPHHFDTHDEVSRVEARESMKQKDENGDGKLTIEEFYNLPKDSSDPEDKLSDEEQDEFELLDTNEDGFLTLEELQDYETEWFHTEKALRHLMHTADKDTDNHITEHELADVLSDLHQSETGEDILYHLHSWAKHNEL